MISTPNVFYPIVYLFLFTILAPLGTAEEPDDVRDLVVKIHTTHRLPDVFRPWTRMEPSKATGSGTLIEGGRILTNAHVVRNANQIYVQPYQSAEMVVAKVVGYNPWMDLAVLELEDGAEFEGLTGLSISEEIPSLKDTVNVFGYPTGGEELSVTEGIVSRIEYTAYRYGLMGLRIQVDAALNPGNSGGPAVVDNKLVGLVFSGIPKSQSIGYLIPGEEIVRFLRDIEDGTVDGKPVWFDSFQTVENSTLRQRLKLKKDVGGLMVVDVISDAEDYPLQRWDVVTHLGEYALDRQGNVRISDDLRLKALYLLQQLTVDGQLPATISRDGISSQVQIPMGSTPEWVIADLFEKSPAYFVYGPLVFSIVTRDHTKRLNDKSRASMARSGSSIMTRYTELPNFPGEELVIVSARPFSHPAMKGYKDPLLKVVYSVNGIEVKNLVHFVEILRDNAASEVVIEFESSSYLTPEILVFKHETMLNATEALLDENGIRFPYSPEIGKVWNQR